MFTIERFATSTHLPTLPEVALRLVELAQQDDPDFGEVSRVIRSDPAISGKVLKTVNSALFGFRGKIDSIEQAVPILGLTLLRTIILSFHLSRHKTKQEKLQPVFQKLWRSSLTQAVLAELIAEQIKDADPPTCFLAAMLQDIGILAMWSETPGDYTDGVLAHSELPNVVASERSYFGFSHVDVTMAILEQWGMCELFGPAIEQHHDRMTRPINGKIDRLGAVLQAAHLGATLLVSGISSRRSLDCSLDQWMGFLRDHFEFTESQAEEVLKDVNLRVEEYSILFNFNIGEGVDTEDVVIAAKDLLQEIALKNQLTLRAEKPAQAERHDEEEELNTDALSGLYNRRFMNKHLNERLNKCIEKRRSVAVLFVDVDKFKPINDTYGHASGDLAIKHVADWLAGSVRKDDLAIRIGGDEFIVILQRVKERELEKIARRIVNDLPQLKLTDDRVLHVTVSVGCVHYQPVRGDTADANWLIDLADQSMYDVKRNGGDSVLIRKFVGAEAALN